MFQLSEDLGYRIYSALGSFYIPSCIMVFVYIRIYFAAKARARRGIRKPPTKPKGQKSAAAAKSAKGGASLTMAQSPSAVSQTTSFITRPQQPAAIEMATNAAVPLPGFRSPPATPVNTTLPVIACDYASDASTSDVSKDGDKDTLKVFTTQGSRRLTVNGDLGPGGGGGRCRASSVAVDTDMVSELEPSSSDSGNVQKCGVVKPVKSRLCKPIFGGRKSAKAAASAKAKRDILDTGKVSMPGRAGCGDGRRPCAAAAETGAGTPSSGGQPRPKPRDPEREKRRIARKKEKRATLILGLIMGSFIACWFPFFCMYILTPLCPVCYIPPQAFTIAFWLGYMNSAINPVIYTIFNKDFRRSFRRVLFK